MRRDASFKLPPREPAPGWYAISATFLADGTRVIGVDGVPKSIPEGSYGWFRSLETVYRAADVLCVYHVTVEKAKRVRRRLLMERAPRRNERPDGVSAR